MKKRNPILEAIINTADIIGKLLLIFTMVFPFVWMVSTALQTYEETLTFPPTFIPASLQWQNFVTVFQMIPILKYDEQETIDSLVSFFEEQTSKSWTRTMELTQDSEQKQRHGLQFFML